MAELCRDRDDAGAAPRVGNGVAPFGFDVFCFGGYTAVSSTRALDAYNWECVDDRLYRLSSNGEKSGALQGECGEWTVIRTTGAPPCPRANHSMTASNASILVFGGELGCRATDELCTSHVYVFNVAASTWTALAPRVPVPGLQRRMHSSLWDGGPLVVFGGCTKKGGLGDVLVANLGPSSATWRSVDGRGDVPPPQSSHSAMRSPRGAVLYGGHSYPSNRYDSKSRVDKGLTLWKACF